MHASRWGSVCLLATAGLVTAPALAGTGAGREQEAFADASIQQMKQAAATVRSKLGGVRTDAAASGCLGQALSRLETVQREAQDARGALRRATLREDLDAIAQASATMSALDARAKSLEAEANACARLEDAPILAAMRDERAPRQMQLESLTKASEQTQKRTSDDRPRPTGAKTRVILAGQAAPASTPSPASPGPATAPPAASPYATDAAHDASMLAYSADLTLAVFQVDRSLGSVEALARELGGYLAQRGDTSVTVRVPRPRFDEALGRIEKLGDVLHRNVAAEDVTDEYVDLELRLKNARAMREQLAGLLRGAAVKDAVEIEKELAKVTEVIEQIEGRLKVMRDKVGYSSITVSFQASAPSTVRSNSILPFAWLDTMGLESLLDVPKAAP
jgi:hypothetical protein